MVFEKTDILLPKIKDYRKWAVVACDQFTSQPEYWENVQKYIGDEVSTYNLILPEAQLSGNNDDKIANINETMNSYLKKNIFETYNNSYIYVERKLKNGAIRKGIVGAIDLEDYDYKPNAKSKIRATEKTVVDRIPPRVKIRENANIELPHVDISDFLTKIKTICVSQSKHKVEYYTKEQQGVLYLDESLGELTVGILQRFLDDYVKTNNCDIDYIHDNDVLKKLSCKSDCIGLLLSAIDKENLFSEIIKNGSLPRKTFSMGHAQEKRYYIEARRIK